MPTPLRWLSLLLLLGCLDSFEPAGARPYAPPDAYHAWWAEIEACARLTGDFTAIAWYEVPGSRYACPGYARGCAGWWRPPHTIYMAQASVKERRPVQHEMLHDLVQRSDHPPVFRTCGV
ncbi:MAG: hypothetical protein ACREMM_09930 [Gemmatimonadales bacterium]